MPRFSNNEEVIAGSRARYDEMVKVKSDLERKKALDVQALQNEGSVNTQAAANEGNLAVNKLRDTGETSRSNSNILAEKDYKKSLADANTATTTARTISNEILEKSKGSKIDSENAANRQLSVDAGFAASDKVQQAVSRGFSTSQNEVTNSPGDFLPGAAERIRGELVKTKGVISTKDPMTPEEVDANIAESEPLFDSKKSKRQLAEDIQYIKNDKSNPLYTGTPVKRFGARMYNALPFSESISLYHAKKKLASP